MIGRLIYLVVLVASALLLGLGMYFQYALHLQPCGPQVLVRYALVLAVLFALFVVAINAGKLVRIVVGACLGVTALVGAVVAAHQSWPHRVPLDFAKLGVNIDSAIRSLPLADVMPKFFLGSGSCDKARWSILGASGSEWAFVAFLLFLFAAFVAARRD